MIFCTVFAVAGTSDGSEDTAELFLLANQSYKAGDFQAAADYYEKIISTGVKTGDIFYNLGNACFKTGRVGRALVNYRKAELLIPRNEDLQTNLQYALELTTDRIECREFQSFLKSFCFWYSKLSSSELCKLFLIINFIFWILLAVRIFFAGEITAITLYVLMFMTLVLGISFGLKTYNTHVLKSGIVIAKEIMVRSGDGSNDTVLFKLHEGAEFSWTDEHAEWVKIELCDGKKGWVQKATVEKITL